MIKRRNAGLDCGRFLAIATVVLGHAQVQVPYTSAIDIGARFAVPYFFILAGFFIEPPRGPLVPALAGVLKRLLTPFLVWLALYLLWFEPPLKAFADPVFLIRLLVQGGPAHHLWFLPSLAVSTVLLLTLLHQGVSPALTGTLAATLLLFGLLFGSYYDVITGAGRFAWNMRNGPFFGFPLMVLGWFIARRRIRPSLASSMALFVLGAAFHAGEILLLDAHGVRFEHDLLIGTIPFGIGFFFVMQSLPDSSSLRFLAACGRYSLGIYCVHLLVLEAVNRLIGLEAIDPLQGAPFSTAALVLVVSLALSLVVAHVGWLRPFVTRGRQVLQS